MADYWEQRVLADERRATEIAQNASDELAKMYRTQYLRVVKEIEKLKGEIDYGQELTRTQLWNYARWRKVEESLRDCVAESTRIGTDVIHAALEKEFERVIGRPVSGYGGALGAGDSILLGTARKARILSGDWSGEHYSARIWKNSSAIADRMRNEITNMLVDGKSTQDIRRTVMREFGVGYHNADRLVQTEVSYVHNQLALEEYRDLGLNQVQILTEANACEVCQEFPGQPYDINSAPFLPAHPRCRCCYAPWTYSDRKRWAKEHPEEGEKKEHLLEVENATPEGSDNLTFKIRPTESALQNAPNPLQNQGFSGIIDVKAEVEKVQDLIRSNATNKGINARKQNAHIRDSGQYVPGKSYLTITLEEAQQLVDEYAGTGIIKLNRNGEWTHKEVVDAGRIIGVDVDLATGAETETTFLKIHYAKDGVHIVPMRRRKKQ